MFNSSNNIRNGFWQRRNVSSQENQKNRNYEDRTFLLSKALIVSKLSRLELEQYRNANLNHDEIKTTIKNRGSDYEAMKYYHEIHKNFERKVAESFTAAGINVQLVNRLVLILV